MGTSGNGGLTAEDYAALVPALAYDLVDRHPVDRVVHEAIEGTLLSADISGFTRLSEELADRGREGAEIITVVVNSCFTDLIGCAEHYGGDVLKFGGDAVLVFFTGNAHQARGIAAGQEMQFALRRNANARRNRLRMTVGVASGTFDALLVGDAQRDVLLCGPATTETLVLEDGAEKGEVVVSVSAAAAAQSVERAGGRVVLADYVFEQPARPNVDTAALAQFVPVALRDAWIDYAELGAVHRQAAIGFVMVTGVDEYLADHGGSAAATELDHFLGGVSEALANSGAVLLHSDMAIGGLKLLIGAGVPRAVDDPADALLHAALAISNVETDLVVRQGVNIGTVFAGFLGAPHRRTFTVMGDVVNTAARMLGPASNGEVVAVDRVIDRARGKVQGELLDPIQVKGKTALVTSMKVEAVTQRKRHEGDLPLVGRESELERLRNSMLKGGDVTVVGAAGAGKTRLTGELNSDAALINTGGRYMTATPYGAFWQSVRWLVGLDARGEQDAAQQGERFRAALQARAPDLVELAPLLAPLVGVELELNDVVAAIDVEFRRDVLHRSFADLLSRHEPPITCIIVEDTQWLDDASVELVDYLASVAEELGWAIIRSARTEPANAQDRAAVTIELGPLADEFIAAILNDASGRDLTAEELGLLVERAHGNPLFALELARAASSSSGEIPGTIEEVIAARLDRLEPAERRLVRLASVLGARFDTDTLAALAASSGESLAADPADLDDVFAPVGDSDSEISAGDGRVYRFRQLLYRDVAYASLPFGLRKELHRSIGIHLEETAPDIDAIATLLSEHFFVAEDRRRTWSYSIRAAERSVRQNSPGDAITMFKRAIDNVPRGIDRADRAGVFSRYGRTLVAAGNLDDAYDAFGRARRLTDEPLDDLRVLIEQADCRNRQGRFSDALKIYSRAATSDAITPELLATVLTGRSSVLYHLSRNRESHEVALQALQVAEETDEPYLVGRALRQVSVAGEAIGSDDYLDAIERALDIFETGGHLSDEAEMRNNLGVIAQLDGRLDDAADAYAASLALKHRVGDLAGAARVQMNLGEVQLDRNSTEGVRDLLRSCLAVFDQTGFVVGSAYTTGLLGRCALLEGDAESARGYLEGAATLFLELGAEGYAADMDLLLIEVLVNLGAAEDATALIVLNRERLERDVFDNPVSAAQRLEQLAEQLP